MSKKVNKQLNEKMNVKLPENLSKDNIITMLDSVEAKDNIVEIKKTKPVKKILPLVASFVLLIGLVGMYFGLGMGEKQIPPVESDKSSQVVIYESYDKIYKKFKQLKKDSEYTYLFGNTFNGVMDDVAEDFADADSAMPESSAEGSVSNSSNTLSGNASTLPTVQNEESKDESDFGTTNRQEEEVDEGDIIKTDGKYLYIANADNKTISIVDVQDSEMKAVARINPATKGLVQEIYINGDKLIVIGKKSSEFDGAFRGEGTYENGVHYRLTDTFVEVYDLCDRSKPQLLTKYSQQGSYNNSRVIGTKLYCISNYWVELYGDDYLDDCIPQVEVNDVCQKIPAGCISVIEDSETPSYSVITTFDISKGTEPTSEAILGNCEELYATSKGLFVSESKYENVGNITTNIYRFEYTDTGVKFKSMGTVDGTINDQFSMSYDGEYFRIATTARKTVTYDDKGNATEVQLFDEDGNRNKKLDNVNVSTITMNNLYILSNDMKIVGKVEDLAEGETIRSVRFVGQMAYVVTFRQTDPLFVIDLSDPINPTVKGELKIPGFSEYLHPIADGLLVGVGYDGTEFGTNGDCKVSLFDVSNPYEPTENSILTVTGGKANCYSPVGANHKLYIKLSDNEFAVPFRARKYVETDYNDSTVNTYIRYKLIGEKLYEVARYNMAGMHSNVMGATYVGDRFYVVLQRFGKIDDATTYVVAYDLNTNEEIGRLTTVE